MTAITRQQLSRDGNACRRIEAWIWTELGRRSIKDTTPARDVCRALEIIDGPPWCELDAFEYVCEMFANWARSHGSLEVMKAATTMKTPQLSAWLRRRRGERVEPAEEIVEATED